MAKLTVSHLAARMREPLETDVTDPISVRRAYTEVLLVYLAFFAPSIVKEVFLLTGHAPPPPGSWANLAPQITRTIIEAALAVVVVVWLSGRRNRSPKDLGLTTTGSLARSGKHNRRARAWLTTIGFGFLGGALFSAGSPLNTGKYPLGPHTIANLVYHLTASANAGIVEELVVLAFVMVTLAQAKRPVWEIVAVAVVVRGVFHAYYGPGAIAVALWVPLVMFVFWRTRTILPIMLAHALFDAVIFLGTQWPVTGAVTVPLVVWVMLVSLWVAVWRRSAWFIRPDHGPATGGLATGPAG